MDTFFILICEKQQKSLDIAKWFKKIYPDRYMLKIDINHNIKYKIKKNKNKKNVNHID